MDSYFKCTVLVLVLLHSCAGDHITNNTEDDSVVYEKWIKLDKKLLGYSDFAVRAMTKIIADLNLATNCKIQTMHLLLGIKDLKPWAVSFIDSTGKMADGVLRGTASAVGNYDQCLNNIVTMNKSRGIKETIFRGKYCVLEINLPKLPNKSSLLSNTYRMQRFKNFTASLSDLMQLMIPLEEFFTSGASMAACVPSACSEDDVRIIAETVSQQFFLSIDVRDCHTIETAFNIGLVVIIPLFGLIGLLASIGTTLEYYSRKHKMKFESSGLGILLSFSVQKNAEYLANLKESKNSLSCLNGFRFLTIAWIILINSYQIPFAFLQLHANTLQILDYSRQFVPQIFYNGALSVDCFFFIGGIVNCYSRIKESESEKSETGILTRMLHRLFRIFPGYVFVLLFQILMFSETFGPSRYFTLEQNRNCGKHWWRNAIFINNFQHVEDMCMVQSWYLSADMQMFIISLFTVPILFRFPKIGIPLNSSLVIASMVYEAVNTWLYTVPPNPVWENFHETRNFVEEYTKPFSHAGPYFLGILLGYFIGSKKDLSISKRARFIGWSISAFLCASVIFGTISWNSDVKPSSIEKILYASTSKIGFCLGLAWIVICCTAGYGGIVNTILSCKIWIPLSRLTFLMFLISPALQLANIASLRTPAYISHLVMVRSFFADLTISCILAAVFYIFIENPFLSVEKVIFSREKYPTQKVAANQWQYANSFQEKVNETNGLDLSSFEKNVQGMQTEAQKEHNGADSNFQQKVLSSEI